MGRFIRLRCTGPCGKFHRFSKSYIERDGSIGILCRPCYRGKYHKGRPIPHKAAKRIDL